MVTSPGQRPLIEHKNQINGETSHMVAAVVFLQPLFSHYSVCVRSKRDTRQVNNIWNLDNVIEQRITATLHKNKWNTNEMILIPKIQWI